VQPKEGIMQVHVNGGGACRRIAWSPTVSTVSDTFTNFYPTFGNSYINSSLQILVIFDQKLP
jgi:hypothetical protein